MDKQLSMDRFDHTSGEYFDIEGARIYYEGKGDPSKPLLVLLHGGFGNIEDFNSFLPYLVDKFRIIGIDSRGCGKSTLGNGSYV